MLENIRIQGFRRYKDFSINDFSQVNFILGDNNVGKTSVLEAIYAWACGQNVAPFIHIPLARGRYSAIQQPYWIMEEIMATVSDKTSIPLQMSFSGRYNGENVCFNHSIYPSEILGFYDTSYKNNSELINMKSQGMNSSELQQIVPGIMQIQQTAIARWEVEQNGTKVISNIELPFSQITGIQSFHQAKFIDVLSQTGVNENVQIYASLKREKLLDEVTKEIRRVFPEIIGFDMIPYPDGTQSPISVIKEDGLLPLYACGDGIQRWFYILGALALYKKSIICIDEIDVGFHHEAQAEFSLNLIRGAITNGVQLFITTHNIEFLDSFLQSIQNYAKEEQNKIRVITIRETEEGQKVRSLSASEAYESRESFNLELR